jgi:hypothetical protein
MPSNVIGHELRDEIIAVVVPRLVLREGRPEYIGSIVHAVAAAW